MIVSDLDKHTTDKENMTGHLRFADALFALRTNDLRAP